MSVRSFVSFISCEWNAIDVNAGVFGISTLCTVGNSLSLFDSDLGKTIIAEGLTTVSTSIAWTECRSDGHRTRRPFSDGGGGGDDVGNVNGLSPSSRFRSRRRYGSNPVSGGFDAISFGCGPYTFGKSEIKKQITSC